MKIEFDNILFSRVVAAYLRDKTLDAAAEATGVSAPSLSRFRAGVGTPKVGALTGICNATNVSPNTLFGLNDCATLADAVAQLRELMVRNEVPLHKMQIVDDALCLLEEGSDAEEVRDEQD